MPTYNYLVVHAHGRITVRDDEAFVRGLVARLTRKMEAGEPVPWKMGDAPRDFIDQMLAAIVGIEIEVTRLVGKAKLSQNKADADRLGAVEGLRRDGRESALADAMLVAPPLIGNKGMLDLPSIGMSILGHRDEFDVFMLYSAPARP